MGEWGGLDVGRDEMDVINGHVLRRVDDAWSTGVFPLLSDHVPRHELLPPGTFYHPQKKSISFTERTFWMDANHLSKERTVPRIVILYVVVQTSTCPPESDKIGRSEIRSDVGERFDGKFEQDGIVFVFAVFSMLKRLWMGMRM